MTRYFQRSRYFTILCALIVILSAMGLGPTLVQAELPPRPTPPVTQPDSDPDSGEPIGGYIALQIPAAPAGLWTAVQWQDQTGGWHKVESWQGTLDDGRQKIWWVQPADFRKGPFRWAVYQAQNGSLLATSIPFYLPGNGYETVLVELLLAPASN